MKKKRETRGFKRGGRGGGGGGGEWAKKISEIGSRTQNKAKGLLSR